MSDFKIIVRNGHVMLNGRRELITCSQAANMLDVSRVRVSQLVDTERLRNFRIGNQVFVLRDEVKDYRESRKA